MHRIAAFQTHPNVNSDLSLMGSEVVQSSYTNRFHRFPRDLLQRAEISVVFPIHIWELHVTHSSLLVPETCRISLDS